MLKVIFLIKRHSNPKTKNQKKPATAKKKTTFSYYEKKKIHTKTNIVIHAVWHRR
jgi:hypothetical protein